MNIAALLRDSGLAFGDRPAITLGRDVIVDYGELARRAATLAGALRSSLGLAAGDRVALVMTNGAAYLEALFGILHAGLVAVPVNAKLHQREFAYILGHSRARLCLVTDDLSETVAPLADELPDLERVLSVDGKKYTRLLQTDAMPVWSARANEPAWLFYTSGTTGRPKGAVLTHRNLLVMIWSYFADIDQVWPDHAHIVTGALSHASGLYALPFIAKAANNVVPESRGFDAAEILELIGVHGNVTLFAAPTMLTRLVHSPALAAAELSNLLTIYYGGGPTYAADQTNAIEAFGASLLQLYGQGEAPMTITALNKRLHGEAGHPRHAERLVSVGLPRTGVEVRVVDLEDNTLPPGEVGEVAVRGDIVMAGYLDNPEASAETLRGGWLHTGDLGKFDEEGFLTLLDRSKDMIISGGSNIYPREIEEVLLTHPDVFEVSVIGRPHPDWGEVVVAFVSPHPGRQVSAAELDRLCLHNIARFKRPKAYFMVNDLPKNNYGKILKTELRRRLESEATSSDSGFERS